ncbi:MAG: PTS system mannose/fructose/N-acetylgalactosamine-transporter subunit IIB [Lacrimispora sphenoides]
MNIVLARIDDRLVHGQVVTDWVKYTRCERIIIVNDQVAGDEIRKRLLAASIPPGIKLNVLTIKKAAEVYHNPKHQDLKAMLIFANPKDVLALLQNGVLLKSINVGGMSYKNGKKQLATAVFIDENDKANLIQIYEAGVRLEIRMLSSDNQIDLMEVMGR